MTYTLSHSRGGGKADGGVAAFDHGMRVTMA